MQLCSSTFSCQAFVLFDAPLRPPFSPLSPDSSLCLHPPLSYARTSCRFPPLLRRHGSKRRPAFFIQAAGEESPGNTVLTTYTTHRRAQLKIPCLLMRSGTSRGTYFLKQHLPQDKEALDMVLLRVMGSPDHHQINGLGGGTSLTSKVAILTASQEPGVDVDYTFAQVGISKAVVDWEPSCGNMLAAVGPAAIEMGLVKKIGNPVTPVKIRATNNGALVEAVVQTPDHQVTYDGEAAIDGVSGTAAPITLNFMNVVGSKTGGKLLPSGQLRDVINGVEVTCMDVAMPMVIAKASAFGKTGYETKTDLDNDKVFFQRMEAVRVIAGEKMGLGNVRGRVIPKFAIVAKPRDGQGNITARYFVPETTHAAMAVTGAICLACCSILHGSVADDVSFKSDLGHNQNRVVVEHPSGRIQIFLVSEQKPGGCGMILHSAGVLRTVRLIFEGSVHITTTGFETVGEKQRPKGLNKHREQENHIHKEFRKLHHFGRRDEHTHENWIGEQNNRK